MHNCTYAPHAVYFRDIKNACHESRTNRLTPGTRYGCRAACGPAPLQLASSATRLDVILIFSRSHLLFSLRTPNAQRVTDAATHHYYTHTIENKNLNSFRASRLAPPPNIM